MPPPLPPITMAQSLKRVLVAQVLLGFLLILLVVLGTAVLSGPATLATLGLARAKAAAFGALLGILATVVTARSVVKSSRAVVENPQTPYLGMLPVYSGLLLKLLIVAGGAFVGLAYWKFGPLYVVLGYITMQAGYLWAATGPER